MTTGDVLTRGAIWLALLFYLGGAVAEMLARRRQDLEATARALWTIGCAAYVAHVLFAFHFFHGWSHAAAYTDTTRQTAAVTGWNWGGGLYVNYAFTAAWAADVILWWFAPDRYWQRPRWVSSIWRGFFLFMVFNATVVFAHGLVRWFGLALCLIVVSVWFTTRPKGYEASIGNGGGGR